MREVCLSRLSSQPSALITPALRVPGTPLQDVEDGMKEMDVIRGWIIDDMLSMLPPRFAAFESDPVMKAMQVFEHAGEWKGCSKENLSDYGLEQVELLYNHYKDLLTSSAWIVRRC